MAVNDSRPPIETDPIEVRDQFSGKVTASGRWSTAWTRYFQQLQKLLEGLGPLTTKGDLLGFGSAPARIPVGADAQVLTADSTQPLGVKWAAPGGTQTPWAADEDAADFALKNLKSVVLNPAAVPANVAGKLAVDANNNLTLSDASVWRNVWIPVLGGVGFQNSWSNYGFGYVAAAYLLDSFGFVHLRGNVKGGSIGGATIFTLPVGFRPTGSEFLTVASGSGTGTYTLARIIITSAGLVQAMVGDNGLYSLSNVSFATF